MKILMINDTTYSMGDITARVVLDTAKGAMKGKNAIYAIEKNNIIEMKKDVFPSIAALKAEATKYIKAGFKVSYVMGGGNGKK